jgi:hypothetical protein
MDRLIAITQAAPLGRQEVRDHDRLALAFGLRHWAAGLLSPCNLVVVILIEYRLIMGDENKSERWAIGDWESIWAWEFMPIIVPPVEAQIINLPPLNKRTSIGHDILSLMAIDIHPVPSTLVSPVQLLQPAGCCLL